MVGLQLCIVTVSLAWNSYPCDPEIDAKKEQCATPRSVQLQRSYVIYSCVLNVVSDLASESPPVAYLGSYRFRILGTDFFQQVMALPIAMLKALQIRTSAKFGLAGVFSCVFIIIAFDIARVVETLTVVGEPGSTALWTNLESAVAVIVSCLPSFTALFNRRHFRNAGRNASPYRSHSLAVSDSAKMYLGPSSSNNSSVGLTTLKRSENVALDPSLSMKTHTFDTSSAV